MGWYPGLFFFMAILTFNLWGQGLRRFLDESRLNISRLFNRYTVMAAGALALGFAWVLQTTSPLGQYRPQVNLYDGLGTGPDGTLLELARALKQSPYQPKKTVVFVAWSGGERGESLSVFDIMNARVGFNSLTVEAVIELSGVGAGAGQGIALGEGSSYRLTQLFRGAASRLGVATTARGQGPHFGLLARPGFGGRSALSAYVSWDGSDRTAHTVGDVLETIDPQKLKQVGQTTLLALTVLSREVDY